MAVGIGGRGPEDFRPHFHYAMGRQNIIQHRLHFEMAARDSMDTMGPEQTDNPVLTCALAGDLPGLQKIFDNPEDPAQEKVKLLLSEQDVVGRSPLFLACMLGRSEVVRELAKHGVDLNQPTPRGYLPIHCAAAWAQLDTLKTLVEQGSDIVGMNFRGEKARDVALRYGKMDCVEFLDLEEVKLTLRLYITQIQATIADPEKVHGRLNKEDKVRKQGKKANTEEKGGILLQVQLFTCVFLPESLLSYIQIFPIKETL
ncbi:ankyrin repeat domain-containing protein 45 isoform X2 [Ambystoma mexicanum]|uniref:ankyrin repeat domain-containing protein 45 isoform X2 n=1 Tax=Ambystoma mexicanum TaxID=8296 RepID=UPI0037E914C3